MVRGGFRVLRVSCDGTEAPVQARLKSAEEQLARKAHILEQQAVDVTNLTVEVTALKAELVRLRDHAASADAKTMATAMEAAAHGMETATLKEREEVLVHELLAAESKVSMTPLCRCYTRAYGRARR